MAKIYYVQKSY